MMAHQAEYRIATMCRVLQVSASGFYSRRARPQSQRQRNDTKLATMITAIHKRSKGTYGRPRVHAELINAGLHVSGKRIARIMRENSLVGASRRKTVVTTVQAHGGKPAPDLVHRDFSASAPNQLWVADMTYVSTWAGFLYLALVLDVYSRRIVGWATGPRMHKQLVIDALNMAVHQRKARGVIHHSDRGTQYTSTAFSERCQDIGIVPSMGRVGNCYDNAMAESLNATIECELLGKHRFRTRAEAELAIFEYIEGWYNRHRRHSAIGYVSPMTYEQRTGARSL